ncbi:MAG: hypothetical protein ABIO17_03015, partial [Pseudoxanthomonas sp.]
MLLRACQFDFSRGVRQRIEFLGGRLHGRGRRYARRLESLLKALQRALYQRIAFAQITVAAVAGRLG